MEAAGSEINHKTVSFPFTVPLLVTVSSTASFWFLLIFVAESFASA
jgi:hypothetical protein